MIPSVSLLRKLLFIGYWFWLAYATFRDEEIGMKGHAGFFCWPSFRLARPGTCKAPIWEACGRRADEKK